MHARRTAVASVASSAGILACPVTSAPRYQLHWSFLRARHADVQRLVGEEVEFGRTSTFELTCDAGTLSALSPGDLGRFCVLSHLPSPCSSLRRCETCRKSPCFTHFLLAHVRVFGSQLDGSTTLRKLRRTMHLRHTADGPPRRELGKTPGLRLFV